MQDYRDYYRFLDRNLSLRISELAVELLGEPTVKKASEWRYGQKGSLSITLSGPHQGRFYDFENGTHGSALDLVSRVKGLQGKDLCQWVRDWLGIRPPSSWVLVSPVPSGALKPDFTKAPLSYLVAGKTIESLHPYKTFQGELLGYVVRLRDAQGHKITPTLTYYRDDYGRATWRWKGFGDQRTPYGLEKLQDLAKTVLIVEGEKTADAAQQLLPHFLVLTWSGGAKAVLKTDWTALKGRTIILWPDHDPAGHEAMQTLKQHLLGLGSLSVQIVNLPATTPPKWDLADPLPPAWVASYLALSLTEEGISSSFPIIPFLSGSSSTACSHKENL